MILRRPWPSSRHKVEAGDIHYFISGAQGFGGQMGGSGASAQIAAWVTQTFTATTVDSVTLYDLTAPTGGTATAATVPAV